MDDHQTKNALFMEKNVGGAITCPESSLTEISFRGLLQQMMVPEKLRQMKEAITSFKQDKKKPGLFHLIGEILNKEK